MEVALVYATESKPAIVLSQLPATIGRQARAAVRIEDSLVSPFQCVIDAHDDLLTVMDLGSVAGTFVNGVRVMLATLMPGDRITLGRTDYLVQYARIGGSDAHAGRTATRSPRRTRFARVFRRFWARVVGAWV